MSDKDKEGAEGTAPKAEKKTAKKTAAKKTAKKTAAKKPTEKKDTKPKTEKTKSKDAVYVYVGVGEQDPETINFMGRQTFVKGEPQAVTDEKVLSKIDTNRCFEKAE